MLIKALCDYAIKQQESIQATDNIIPNGFSKQKIDYRIIISTDGELKDIIPSKETVYIKDKKGNDIPKEQSRIIIVPERIQKTGPSYKSYYLEHRPLYIFGLNYDKGIFSTEDKTNKAQKSHAAFVKHEREFLDDLNSVNCQAYKKFIEKWKPENEINNPILKQLGNNYDSSKYAFSVDMESNYLEEDEQFISKYKELLKNVKQNKEELNEDISVCGILGIKDKIARTHNIKINIPNGKPSSLVNMNANAFESYGKEQSYNSNISETAVQLYTKTLNTLFEDKSHYCWIGDTLIFWFAIKLNDYKESNIFSKFLNSFQNNETDNELITIMNYIKKGCIGDIESINNLVEDVNVDFYVSGLTVNESRLCVKFIHKDNFGNLLKNLIKHQMDMQITKDSNNMITFNAIAKELISPISTKDVVSPPLISAIIYSAFNNTKYPDSLLTTIIRRIKTDRDTKDDNYIKLNNRRLGIIKACLNRKLNKEEITMAWNENNKNPAYLCGGLFAVYEKLQRDSYKENFNTTIKDSYFSSACSCPASVFPKLGKLAQYHLSKIEVRFQPYYNKLIQELFRDIKDKFPTILSVDDQGSFIIGYHQMMDRLYTKKETDDAKDKNINNNNENGKDV